MKDTYLVQRLNKPVSNTGMEMFSFGGGLKNGGLSENAMKLLRPIFSFDYMGSAEFEFGAVPESFSRIVQSISDYGTWETSISKQKVYVIGNKAEKDDLNIMLESLSKGKMRLKASSHFDWALGLDKWMKKECPTIGWLDLNNNFLFFIDKDAAEKTANLFDLTFNN